VSDIGDSDVCIESCEGLDCEGLLVRGLTPGGGEGGTNVKDAPVVLDEIEVSEALRRRVGDAGGC
jgi:hypothetical protein